MLSIKEIFKNYQDNISYRESAGAIFLLEKL